MNHERSTTEQSIGAWLGFLRAHSRVTAELERELEATESLPMNWFDVLEQLRHAPGRQLRMQELGERLAMSASGLSRRVSRMEQVGLVERRPCPEDRRGVLVVLTNLGARRHRRALPVHLRGVEQHFLSQLTPEEAQTLECVFERVLDGLNEPDAVATDGGREITR